MPKVKAVRIQSMFGMIFIYVILEDNADIYRARSRALEKLSQVSTTLPEGVKPVIGPDGTGVGHIFWYHLKIDKNDLGELRALQDYYLKLGLQSVKGVAEVASAGGFVKQYQIDVDHRLDIESLKKIWVTLSNGKASSMNEGEGGNVNSNSSNSGSNNKAQIPLGELVDIKITSGPPMISSEDALLRWVVFLNVRDRDMGSFVNGAKEVFDV